MSWFRKYRVVPIVMSVFMLIFLWDAWEWFQALEDRSSEDNAFMGALVIAAVGWFKFYVDSGNKES